jgi:Fe-S cluster assembly protein SufD
MDLKSKILNEYSAFENNPLNSTRKPLHSLREKAARNFELKGFPNRKMEEWKYDKLGFLDTIDFNISLIPPNGNFNINEYINVPVIKYSENYLVFINGFYCKELSHLNISDKKIFARSLAKSLNRYDEELIKNHLGKYAGYENDPFVSINTALSQDGAYIYIPDGVMLEEPIQLIFLNDSRQGEIMSNPRNLIIVGDCSQVKILETNYTIGDKPSLTNMVTEIVADRFANVDYYKVQNNGENSYYIGTIQASQERGSVFNNSTVTIRGNFIRNNLNTRHNDEGCESNYHGFYLLEGKDFVDNHTLVDHAKPNCTSSEVYKGIIGDYATAVFNGKIVVRPDAQKTNAYQSNKNILMSDNATINTKPQLEIFADDVKCSHGAASGNLDKESLFYLKSRGIGEEKAKALLLNAFASDVVEKINISELRDQIKQQIAVRLNMEDIFFCDVLLENN